MREFQRKGFDDYANLNGFNVRARTLINDGIPDANREVNASTEPTRG